jgi:hypothetical protein
MAVTAIHSDFGRQAFINAAGAQQAQRRHEIQLAQIRAGVQPNRTPSSGLLQRLGEPIPGSPGAGGGGGGDFTPLPAPPGVQPRSAAGGGTPVAAQGSSIGTNAPPTAAVAAPGRARTNSAAGALRSFLDAQRG